MVSLVAGFCVNGFGTSIRLDIVIAIVFVGQEGVIGTVGGFSRFLLVHFPVAPTLRADHTGFRNGHNKLPDVLKCNIAVYAARLKNFSVLDIVEAR